MSRTGAMIGSRREWILSQTEAAAPSLCPELKLRLITDRCPLWSAGVADLERLGLPDPFWAFAWPGGQALARHLLMVFAFGLVPVVGNFLSGAVLMALAYLKKGFFGVVVFSVSTFVLHKVESYYLNPRLTAKHVKLPSVLLIASLIIWEHLAGLAGVFLSFPALYVAMKVRDLFREDLEAPAGARAAPAPTIDPKSASGLGR